MTEVKIGVIHTPREISVEVDEAIDALRISIGKAIANEDETLWLTDTKGRTVGIPSKRIAYVEIAEDRGNGGVGFSRG